MPSLDDTLDFLERTRLVIFLEVEALSVLSSIPAFGSSLCFTPTALLLSYDENDFTFWFNTEYSILK